MRQRWAGCRREAQQSEKRAARLHWGPRQLLTRFGHSTSGKYQCNFSPTVKQNSLADRCPKKRRRAEVSVSSIGSPGAVGRHGFNPEIDHGSYRRCRWHCMLHIRALPTACVLTGRTRLMPRLIGFVCAALLFTHQVGSAETPTQDERQALAPNGKLRAAVLITNPIYVIKDESSGELRGVSIDLVREMARRIGVPFETVAYTSAGALVASATAGQWDITFVGIPVGERHMELSPPYVQIEMGYLVPKDSLISTTTEVDTTGIRIAVQEKGGADTLLTPTLKRATLVRRSTIAEAVEAVRSGDADAMAAIKTYLIPTSQRLSGSRVLDGRIAVEGIAIGVPKGNVLSAAYVRRFIEQVKTEGFVKAAVVKAGIRGLEAAP